MLYSILTSLAVVAALVGLVAWFIGFVAAARAIVLRGAQLLSTDVKALQRPGAITTAEVADSSVPALRARMLKAWLVFAVALASAAALALLGDWLTGQSG